MLRVVIKPYRWPVHPRGIWSAQFGRGELAIDRGLRVCHTNQPQRHHSQQTNFDEAHIHLPSLSLATVLVLYANLMDKPRCEAQKHWAGCPHADTALAISYNRSVRRLLALSLLLLFSFPLVSPLLALSSNSDANLPVCCRRNGVHHCGMKLQRSNTSAHQISVSTI